MLTMFRNLPSMTLCLLVSIVPVFDIQAAEIPEYEWQPITMTAPWAARDGAGLLSFQGKMWLLGGWNPDPAVREFFPLICNNEVWSSEDGAKWSLVKPNTFKDRSFDPASDWEGRHTAGYAVYHDRMWIIGGDCNQKHDQNDVWNSTDGIQWTELSDTPWKPRHAASLVVHNGSLWMIAGNNMQPAVGRLTRKSC